VKHLIKYQATQVRCSCHIGGTTEKTRFTLTVCGELICPQHEGEKLADKGKLNADCPECLKLAKEHSCCKKH